jgi:transposase
MPRVAKEIKCNDNDIMALKSIVDNPLSDSRLAMKASALLLCISGKENKEVASILGVRQNTVGDWRKAFIEGGIEGLMDKKRPGRRGSNAPDMRERVKEKLKEEPANGEMWTAKALSDAVGTSVDTVRRALREEGVSLERRTKWAFPAEGVSITGIYRYRRYLPVRWRESDCYLYF